MTRLAVLDIVPTRHVLGNVTRAMAMAYYHWFFLPVGNGVPEHMIAADPGYWIRSLAGPLLGEGASIDPQVMADYVRCFGDPGTIAGITLTPKLSSGMSRLPSGASTPPTSAATRYPPVTSCPKKRRNWSMPRCAISSIVSD